MSAADRVTPADIPDYSPPRFTVEERQLLEPYFSNLDLPVFVVRNLPQEIAGALFARYSRTSKSLRRLFLDEFVTEGLAPAAPSDGVADVEAARSLYDRIFLGFGDDSVAQLGGAHVAIEGASNILTKVIEWGRLAAYLEQSTRYIRYDDRVPTPSGPKFRYHTPAELADHPSLSADFTETMDHLFETYGELLDPLLGYFSRFPRPDGVPDGAWRGLVRSRACDTIRGLLPAATRSNLGVFATGQALESLLLRLQASPLEEARLYSRMILAELRTEIPAFMSRVDRPDRGLEHSDYLASIRDGVAEVVAGLVEAHPPAPLTGPLPRPTQLGDTVVLCAWDPEGELAITQALLFEGGVPFAQAHRLASQMSDEELDRLWAAAVGERRNRRHRPSRAFEETFYTFEIVSDYGAYRDLQRHRMMTVRAETLTPAHGYHVPELLADLGLDGRYRQAMDRAADLHEKLVAAGVSPHVAAYAVPFGYRLRYQFTLNARQAFHLLELRTQPSGHPSYRLICQEMFRQIRDVARHRRVAAAMSHVDLSAADEGRLQETLRHAKAS